MRKRKILLLILVSVMCISAFGGCGQLDDKIREQNTLTIQYSRNIPYKFIEGLEAKFPKINFVYDFYQGGNYTEYIGESLKQGEAADIIAHTICLDEKKAHEYLVDLSGYNFLGNYDNAMMNTMARNGHVYQVPGPVSTRCIFYNKTLFEMYGWEVPSTYNELLELVKQIRREAPDITPIAMSTVASGYTFTLVTSFAQCGFLSTPAGAEWEKMYFEGKASVAEGFAEGFTMVEQLIDANAFDGEKYTTMWNVVSGDPCERKAAMTISLSGTLAVLPLLEKTAKPEEYGQYCLDDFGLLPFFGIDDGQEGLSIVLTSTWGINKELEGNEKKLENALRVMEYISSEEGQLLLQTDSGQIPTLKNLENTDVHPEIKKLWELNERGKKTPYLYSGYEDIIVDGGQIVMDAILADSSDGMREKFIEVCDNIHKNTLQGETAVKVYGKIAETLSIEETGKLSMAAVLQASPADFVLATYRGIDSGVINNNGVGGKLFKGDVTETKLNILISNYGHMIYKTELNGAEVKNMLQDGKKVVVGEAEGHFDYIAYGLDVDKKDGFVISAKLNGAELVDNEIYTVNFVQGDFDATLAETHSVINTEITVFDALVEYLTKNGTITVDKIK